MSSSTAELTLILRAQNLAKAAIGDLQTAVATVGTKAQTAGSQLGAAFAGKGAILARELGNLTVSLLNGQDFLSTGLMLGATLAGGLVTAFGEKVIAQITGSALFATIGGALSAAGAAIGSFITAAIPIGMAAAPFLLLAALVAAIAFLVTHPDIAAKVLEVAGNIVRGIVGGLVGLPLAILGAFAKAIDSVNRFVASAVITIAGFFLAIPGKLIGLGLDIVTAIVGGMISLPGKVADIIRQAFANLKIDVGPFHITGAGITIDLPNFSQDPRFAGQTYAQAHGLGAGNHASGGWAGLHGPELSWLGERGPEYVIPNHQLGGMGGGVPVTIPILIDGHELGRIVDERLYYAIQAAPVQRKPA